MKSRVTPSVRVLALVLAVAVPSLPLRAVAQTPPAPPAPTTSPSPPPPPEPEALPPPPPPTPTVTRRTVAYWAAGLAVVGAGAATVFGVLALQNKSDYQNNPTFGTADAGNNDAAYADGCIALAAAAGVTSLVLFLTSTPADPGAPAKPSASLSASPIVLPHGGGAGAILRF
jgi:uncharacterized membrane protein